MNIKLTYRQDGYIDVELTSGGEVGGEVSKLLDTMRRAGFRFNVQRVDESGVEFDGVTMDGCDQYGSIT